MVVVMPFNNDRWTPMSVMIVAMSAVGIGGWGECTREQCGNAEGEYLVHGSGVCNAYSG